MIGIISLIMINHNQTKLKYIEYNGFKLALSVDGNNVTEMPSGNYFLVSYECSNGTILTWDRDTSTLVSDNINVNDSCYLEFESSPLLYDLVSIGDYISYTGDSSYGCSSSQCSGWNASQTATDNYDNYGYCYSSNYKYYVYGWRVIHKTDNSVYIVSAGSPECVSPTYIENGPSTSTSSLYLGSSSSYYYGTHYTFNPSTGKYSLNTSAEGYTSVADIFSNLCTSSSCSIADYYTCKSTSETGTCSTMYKIASYNSSTYANTYTYYNISSANNISLFNEKALKYCNTSYLSGGVCDETTAHALNGDDFYKFTTGYYGSNNARYLYGYNDGGTYGSPYCYNKRSNTYCGYNNDLIDNGGHYWFGSGYSFRITIQWYPEARHVSAASSTNAYGVRPVLKLDSSIQATGGTGTMTDPYTMTERVVSG